MTKDILFYPVQKKHQLILHEWMEKPHVKEYFYGEGLKNFLTNLALYINGKGTNGKYFFDFWIAYLGEEPLGLLMTTPVEGPFNSLNPYNKWYENGSKIITLDLLIGEEKFLGRGFGQRMIKEFLSNSCSNVSKVLIDPAVENARAIHVYEKVGFKKIEQFSPDYDPKPHWMMHLDIN